MQNKDYLKILNLLCCQILADVWMICYKNFQIYSTVFNLSLVYKMYLRHLKNIVSSKTNLLPYLQVQQRLKLYSKFKIISLVLNLCFMCKFYLGFMAS